MSRPGRPSTLVTICVLLARCSRRSPAQHRSFLAARQHVTVRHFITRVTRDSIADALSIHVATVSIDEYMPSLSVRWIGFLTVWAVAAPAIDAQPRLADTLAVAFDEKRGQVEVGGAYAGVEFHDSRPVPARISFYYPVANSIDLSTDYWRRGESRPLSLTVRVDGRTDTLGAEPWAYLWTPYSVAFDQDMGDYDGTLEYRFADELPIVVMRLTLRNRMTRPAEFTVASRLSTSLRTSHRYVTREPADSRYVDDASTFVASFDAADTDSVDLFVVNAGAKPVASERPTDAAAFTYAADLEPGDSLVVIQLIGTSRRHESDDVRRRARATWNDGVRRYEDGIRRYVSERGHFELADPELRQTDGLARALLRANRHYLDGKVVPMPSPAEYNFFFTHDLLLTDLGAVFFDTERVRDDLLYVQSLVRGDSVLPHARYWRDSTYVTEPANADNWNHLWAVILAASYLKHSGDTATVEALYPTLRKSMQLMLRNEREGLMYAERPDWWDIGHVYGPRAYLTALTIRALEAYAFVTLELGQEDESLAAHTQIAARMRTALVDRLWDADAGYLLNGLDSTTVDRHYYTGSLLAAAFDLLDVRKRDILLETARRELLDESVGMRNAMPADFHLLRDVYHFQEGEVGEPFLYMNGGVWPQGNAWYALALIAAGRVDDAREALRRYLSIAGVMDSPNGQPAFYEYRNADPESPTYGAVDKPTFLWAGGWYLHVLYQLAGVRESPWNLSFSPDLSAGFEEVSYDLAVAGAQSRVSWSGSGSTFQRIIVDGIDTPSAVMTGPASTIALIRGAPGAAYLSKASCIVDRVRRGEDGRSLTVHVRSAVGQRIELEVIGPIPLTVARVKGQDEPAAVESEVLSDDATATRVSWISRAPSAVVTIGSGQ